MKMLCGTDLLPKSDSALERAGMLTERMVAKLVLIHAVPQAEPHYRLDEELRHAGRQLRLRAMPPRWSHRVSAAFEVRAGSPVQVLVDAARELEPQLIVLGSNRRRFASDALTGTTAERVLKQVDCPVLVVRRMPWRAYRRVLLILDCAGSNEVVAAAGRWVFQGEASTEAAQAHDSFCASTAPVIEDFSARRIERPLVLAQPVNASSALAAGQTSQLALIHERMMMRDATHHHVGRLNPDLLVLGAPRRGWLRRMIPSSAVSRVLAMRGSDVLIVPRRRDCVVAERKPGSRPRWRWAALRHTPWPGDLCQRRLPWN